MAFKFCVHRGLRNQYIAGVAACLSMLATGTCYGWLTPILSHLLGPDSEIPIPASQEPWAVSIIEIGFMLSPLPSGVLINYIGRKPVLLATMPIFIIGWLIILYFPTALMFSIGRMVHGLAMGVVFTVAPVYLGEIASNESRGAITSMSFNSWWLGFLIEYSVGPFLSFYNFTYFTIAFHVPFLLLFCWQPESPYYCVMIGDEEKAYQSLKWFRDVTPEKLKEELEEMKYSAESRKKSSAFKDIVATAVDRKALCLLSFISSVRVLGGNGSLIVYITQVFDMTPNLSFSPDIATIACGVIMFAGGCISSFTLDTFGRRRLLLVSSIGCLLCQFCVGTYYLLLFKTSFEVSQFSWIVPVLIIVYSGLCTAGMYPVCSAYTSELFNTNVRGVASSISSIFVTSISYLMLLWFQPLTNYIGLYANFYVFSISLLLGSVYFYYSAPETKGRSFVQIRKELCEMNSAT